MPSYQDLRKLFSDSDLLEKVEVAVAVAAYTIISKGDTDPPFDQTAGAHDLRVEWANAALLSTRTEAKRLLIYVLAANLDKTVSEITSATGPVIQTHINGAIDELAKAASTSSGTA